MNLTFPPCRYCQSKGQKLVEVFRSLQSWVRSVMREPPRIIVCSGLRPSQEYEPDWGGGQDYLTHTFDHFYLHCTIRQAHWNVDQSARSDVNHLVRLDQWWAGILLSDKICQTNLTINKE